MTASLCLPFTHAPVGAPPAAGGPDGGGGCGGGGCGGTGGGGGCNAFMSPLPSPHFTILPSGAKVSVYPCPKPIDWAVTP